MATEQTLTTLIINKVDSKETFNKMKAQGLVNENELYLTPEGGVAEQQIKVQTASGAITKTLTDNHDYTFNNVSTLNLTAGTGSCHGFITFGSSKPTVSLHGFTKVDGDIMNAAASTVWEFSCYNKYAVFKNWSEV